MMRERRRASWRFEAVWGGDRGGSRAVQKMLAPLETMFRAGVRLRTALYDREWLRIARVPTLTISIGNLRVGGTGKTPLAVWLVGELRRRDRTPLVVSRGYGGVSRNAILDFAGAVSDAGKAQCAARGFVVETDPASASVRRFSDEARLIATRCGVPVGISPRRADAAILATTLGCDCIVLDDGFQHRGLARDLDIVLVSEGEEAARMLPAGPLREPWDALARAHVVLVSGRVGEVPGRAIVAGLSRRSVGLVDAVAYDAELTPTERLKNRSVVAVAGIARPSEFFEMLRDAGANLRAEVCYPDHHDYTEADWRDLRDQMRPGDWVVTTEKDLVKLRLLAGHDADLKALRIEVVPADEDAVLGAIGGRLEGLDPRHRRPHDREFGPHPAERDL